MPDRYWERPYVPAKDPLAAIPPSRHPFQFWVLFALAVTGLANAFVASSEILAVSLDPFFHRLWAVILLVSSLIGLAGPFWPDRVTGLLLERLALITIGVICPVYGVVFTLIAGLGTGPGGPLTFTVGIAAFWRALHVNRELRQLRRFMRHTHMYQSRIAGDE